MKDTGQIPPQSIDTEKAVIGALIVESGAYLKVSDMLNFQSFYLESHQTIFICIQEMFALNIKIDLVSLVEYLMTKNKLDEIGGAYYLSELSTKVASAHHIQTHARILGDLAIRRTLIQDAHKIYNSAYDRSVTLDELLHNVSSIIDKALNMVSNKANIKPFKDNLSEEIERIAEKQKAPKNQPGTLKTPLRSLSAIVPEWKPGNLIVLAGRPGMGKTAYALFEASEMVKKGDSVLFFSLEMTVGALTNRFIQGQSGLTGYDFDNPLNPAQWDILENVFLKYKDCQLFIDDSPLCSFIHIKSKATVYKKLHGIKAIFIDYLQLVKASDPKQIREQQVAELTRNLKALAKELEVPIFLLAQLNREVENRPDKMPKLADLRESGAIEQDADIVLFPFRPEYYWKEDRELKGKGSIICAKNREGKTGEANVLINETVTKYTDVERVITFEERQTNF
jgi:replicative DNA helicase